MSYKNRPQLDNLKSEYKIPMTETEYKKLQRCCKLFGLTETDIISLGIEKAISERTTSSQVKPRFNDPRGRSEVIVIKPGFKLPREVHYRLSSKIRGVIKRKRPSI